MSEPIQRPSQSYRDLVAWQKAMHLTGCIYRLSARFPAEETFGWTSQLRGAAVSVPSNLAEGHARNTAREFTQFIPPTERSAAELETELIVAIEPNFCSSTGSKPIQQRTGKVQPLASALRRSLAPNP